MENEGYKERATENGSITGGERFSCFLHMINGISSVCSRAQHTLAIVTEFVLPQCRVRVRWRVVGLNVFRGLAEAEAEAPPLAENG